MCSSRCAESIVCRKNGNYADRVGVGAPVHPTAVLEYLVAEVMQLELAGNAARDNHDTG